ncbi:NAD(P)-binding protein [Gluconacetobacter tumulisoli]|uniref:NAD(P)-binding protein n=1 Tax=Gluconacetobacter tumulisoli TaxID=1286189 RepID=A0A7W4K8G1_9PROT|nr:NAD(P)-binding protein [Gluconacetobacter tumulisoli]MBB2202304.1 NAD(P)-binding protein [Gluconacetobacter tumulisoli]
MMDKKPDSARLSREDISLGMGKGITRRDFLNSTMIGAGASLLGASCPMHAMAQDSGSPAIFDGYGGVGDYARANGNVRRVVRAAHRIRDGLYDGALRADDDGESVDLVIVGGGLTGLMTARQFVQATGGRKSVLILENHPVFGGEARQNEFSVDGIKLIGPQGSNDFLPPAEDAVTPFAEMFRDFSIPRSYDFQKWDTALRPLRFALDNYSNMDGFDEQKVDVAYYFDQKTGAKTPGWVLNIWRDGLARTPWSGSVKADLARWRDEVGNTGTDDPRVLDTMTYKHYLEVVQKYDPAVTGFAQPMVGLLGGVGADAISARTGHHLVMGNSRDPLTLSFPGGNALLARYLAAGLIPGAVEPGFDAANCGAIHFDRLDRPGQTTRIRLNATVARVRNVAEGVEVIWERDGKLTLTRGKAVVMASGGWVNKHILADLPDEIMTAYQSFAYAPAMIANVALHNWRFLYNLGATAARWFDDGTMFGFSANIRRTMTSPSFDPPLHPDKPALLTFYMGLYTPGYDARVQGTMGRMRLLSTSWAEYERQIRSQMTRMFGPQGFDAARDIAGIVLNRWGHARVIQQPGFYYGTGGKPPPRDVVAQGYGRIIIAHSELEGAQNYTGAFKQGTRAAQVAAAMI